MSTLFTDSGTGADANPIGGNYTTFTGFGAFRRASNKIGGASGTNNAVYVNSVADQTDSWIQGKVGTNSGKSFGLMLRASTSAGDAYLLQLYNGSTWDIAKWTGGSYSVLSTTTLAFAQDDVIYFEIQGTTLLAKHNGATVSALTVTDSTYSTGRFGLYSFADIVDTSMYDITAGDFSGGAKPAMYYYGAR